MLLPSALGFSPHPPVSVYGTGDGYTIAAFPGSASGCFPTYISVHVTDQASGSGFSICPPLLLVRVSSFRAHPSALRPRSSDIRQCRNLCLLSIGYVFRPRLRSRLPQSRSALLWKPWIFGLGDSHSHLATHSGILSCMHSTAPCRYRFSAHSMLLYQSPFSESSASVVCFSPGNFRRGTSRPVSCYALFQCMAASEPTSWLSSKSHILYHLTHTLGP